MKNLLLLLLLLCSVSVNAQTTQVSGNQSGTWDGEIHIIDDVMVPKGETLVINPGTSVIADGYFEMLVLGSLYAIGEDDSRITFTVADTTGYSDYENAQAGAWRGIFCQKSDNVKLSYCDFSYGKTELNSDGGVMRIYNTNDVEISHCTFHHNTARRKGGALFAENSVFDIHDCEIYDNFTTGFEGSYSWGTGCQFLKSDIHMHDMVFHDNFSNDGYGGGMNVDSCNLELNNAIFYNNSTVNAGGLGIQRCKEYTVKVSNMLAYNNSVIHYGGGLAMATSDPELNNLTIVNNYCGGGGGAGMQMAFDASPTLKNCIVWGNHAVYTIEKDTVEYYLGSQIWLWGSDCYPTFYNGVVQYGLDTINSYPPITDDRWVDMTKLDPLFVDETHRDYRLTHNSPCINTGVEDTSGMFLPDTDLAGGPRIFQNRIDRGCYEWNNIGVNENFVESDDLLVYPNPLNDNAFCQINLSRRTNVVLRLISLDGKEVYREECGTFEAGKHKISLDGMMKNIEKVNKIYLLNIDNQFVKVIY